VVAREKAILTPLIKDSWIFMNHISFQDKPTPWTDDFINILAPIILKLKL
jgi:hypothetical protein